jgi:sodium pump decarboxylase gamma subunit
MKMPPDPSFLEKLWFGVEVMLAGMAIVFSVLILLWGILELFGYVSKKITEKAKKPATLQQNEKTAEIISESANKKDEDENEIIAAITAAVSCVMDKPVSGFKVVSFKKRNDWKSL